jgi:hypothetical protein
MSLKATIATAAFLFCIGGNLLVAQEKYDLAVVSYLYDTPKPHIAFSINGEKFEMIDIEKEEMQGKVWGLTPNPLIKRVNQMQSEGWEVVGGLMSSYNSSTGVSQLYYSLRKKRN